MNQVLVQTQALYSQPTKANVEALTNAIIAAVDAHPESALLALAQLSGWKTAVEKAIANVRSAALKQCKDAPTNSFEENGVKYQIKKSASKNEYRYYYDENGDKVDNTDYLAKLKVVEDAQAELDGEIAVLKGKNHFVSLNDGTLSISVILK